MFKYELHLHTRGCSRCAQDEYTVMIDKAEQCGYHGVVLTNHFYRGSTAVDTRLPWEQFVEVYEKEWVAARDYGQRKGVTVFFGIEEVYEPGHEVLIYGISPAQLKATPSFTTMRLHDMAAFVRHCGGFIAVAHPFRERDYIPPMTNTPDASCFDGVEVHNHYNTVTENGKAMAFAQKNGLALLSGSDAHDAAHIGKTGIAVYERITTDTQLVAVLKKKAYRLIIDGEIVWNS